MIRFTVYRDAPINWSQSFPTARDAEQFARDRAAEYGHAFRIDRCQPGETITVAYVRIAPITGLPVTDINGPGMRLL